MSWTPPEGAPTSFVGTPATAPGPDGPTMLRGLQVIRRNPLRALAATWRAYGDVVQYPIPRPPTYLVNDPAGVRRVLVDNARNYGKSTIQYRALSLVTGEGLLVADTEQWRRQRPLVQPAFHHRTLETLVGHVVGVTDDVRAQWRALPSGAVVDVDTAMMRAALEVVGHALFGTDLSDDAERLGHATLAALEVVVARARVPLTPPAWMPTPGNLRLRHAVGELDAAVRSMLTQPVRGHDMLDLLREVRDESGAGLSVQEIRDQIVTFIVAGHETVASALTWAWALLARDQDVQDALAQEARAVLGDRAPVLADLERLPYARAVVDETLRLYPPAWLITRKAREADNVGGHDIPAGAIVIVSPWLLHRHPDRWDEPAAFRPERFLSGDVDRTAFIPFGAGPRLCIGRDFSYVEAVLMLAGLARDVRLTYPAGTQVPRADALVTLRPVGGLPLRVSPRS